MNVSESLSIGACFDGTVGEQMLGWQQMLLVTNVAKRIHVLALPIKKAFIEKRLGEHTDISGNWCQK